jgi:bifunctional non-homologous end joining protein LigD
VSDAAVDAASQQAFPSPLGMLDAEARTRLRPASQPANCVPMQATLAHEPFSDDGWIFERKLDGVRCVLFRRGDEVGIRSRNDKPLEATYPELVDAVGRTGADDFVVDGEVVAFEGGLTSFSKLQQRMQLSGPAQARASGVAVYCYLFDVIDACGHDTTGLGVRQRKRVLRALFAFGDPLRLLWHRIGDGEALHRHACANGWEGVIAKRGDSVYRHTRSRQWLKLKCVNAQELVIGGYTEPGGGRTGFGALLVGYYQGQRLVYAGKVGTGYDEAELAELARRLGALEQPHPPLHHRAAARRGRALGGPQAGGPGRVHRMDRRRPAAPPPVPRAARRQSTRRRSP